jgi:hypothetical protein
MRLLVMLTALIGVDAAADAPRHALHWTREPGAESCIDADALTTAVEARLGRPVFVRTEPPAVIVEGHVSPSWHVAIAVRGTDGSAIGERVLDEPSVNCHALDEALVLVISLIIDPNATAREPPPSVTPREPWHARVGASLLGAAGILPGASLGGALRVAIDAPLLPTVELHGTWWLPDETLDQNQGGRFRLLTGGVALRIPLWKLDTGFGFELGRMIGTGLGFDRVQEARAVIPALTIDPAVAWPLGPRIFFTAGLSLWMPLSRPQFTFEQGGQDVVVYQPAHLTAVLHAGAALHF